MANKEVIILDDSFGLDRKKILAEVFGSKEAEKVINGKKGIKPEQRNMNGKENTIKKAVDKTPVADNKKTKIIISRKGFDAENGGMPSPIMPDGSLLSFPIPSGDIDDFTKLVFHDKTYKQLINELKPGKRFYGCHIDPDIRVSAHKKVSKNWVPVFGQCDAAEKHLENQGVKEGDIFLFFGWFKKTEEYNGSIRYQKGAKDLHVLYGYLQIGKIVKDHDVMDYLWHPHSCYDAPLNTMYVASEKLIIDGEDLGLPGAGVFKYSDELVLTYPGMPKSRWKLPEFFKEVNISCHSKDSFKPEGFFQSVRIGQEFVVSESPKVTKWAKELIRKNYTPE